MDSDTRPPDSWDNVDQDMSRLNVNATPFVPNVNAPVFVPAAMRNQVQETPLEVTQSIAENKDEAPASWDDGEESPVEEVASQEKEEEEEEGNETLPQEDLELKLAIQEAPKPSQTTKAVCKVEELIDDGKDHFNIIFIGHVDAGKSTIGGHLLFLTGQVDKRTLEKYEREAKEKNRETWYLSWALDTNLEERDKGKTVEVGRASFDTATKHFVLLDAPGHKSFVPNMIGGAAQADVGVLVISARKGEFETGFERGGQTRPTLSTELAEHRSATIEAEEGFINDSSSREHAMLAKTAGVKHLVVLVNKMDDPTVNWEQERYKDVETKLSPFLRKVGFRPNEVYFMPCSGFTGANLKDAVDPKICPWYKGPSFLDHLDKLPSFDRPVDGPVKVLVSERYKDMGTIVIGKVESGTVVKGQAYSLMPNKNTIKILNIIGADEQEKNSCKAGENVKLKLMGVEEEEVLPGFIICSNDSLCNTGKVFDAQVVILEHKSIICPGYSAVLHIHNAVEEVTLQALIATIDKKTGERNPKRPRFVKQDQVCIARFQTANMICLETFAKFQPMGRFTLRDEGKTIAIGKVLKIFESS